MDKKKSLIAILFGVVVLIVSSVLFLKSDFLNAATMRLNETVTMDTKESKELVSLNKESVHKEDSIKKNELSSGETVSLANKNKDETLENKKEEISHKEKVSENSNIESSHKDEKSENKADNHSNTEIDKSNKDDTHSTATVSQSKAEGEKYKLPVTPQLQQLWYYCAPTTVSMMLSARGIDVDQFQLAKEMGTYEPYGTHNVDAIRILNKYMFGTEQPTSTSGGYQLETVTQVDEATLTTFKQRVMKNIQDGYPMYYTFDVSKIYPGLEGEHNVIGNGYVATPDGNDVAYIYYIDPSPNVQDGAYGSLKIVTPEELLNAMVSCGEPNYAW